LQQLTVLFAQEAAASPGDDAAPQRPQDIVRKATKQVGMMGFLKPLADDEKLSKEADAEASRKAPKPATKCPQECPQKLIPDYKVKLTPQL
jgi:hypothetical protein